MSYLGIFKTDNTDFSQVLTGWVDDMQLPDDGRVEAVTYPVLCAVLGKEAVAELHIVMEAAGYDLKHDKPDEDDSLLMRVGKVTLNGDTAIHAWIVAGDGSAYVFRANQDPNSVTLSDSCLLMWVGACLEQSYQIGRNGKTITRLHYVPSGPTADEHVMEGPNFNDTVRAALLYHLGYDLLKGCDKKDLQ